MDDELVEAVAEWVRRQDIVNGATGTWKQEWNAGAARDLLAALREAGFDVYRPDDCQLVHRVGVPGVEATRTYYRIVPERVSNAKG